MRKVSSGLKYVFLSLVSIISLFPFLWMLISTTNKAVDINAGKFKIGAELATNFQNMLINDVDFLNSLKNSAIIAIITTIFALIISSAAGYGFEIFQSKRKELIFNILLLSMMVPFSALMIPLYTMFSKLNATPLRVIGLDSLFSVIVPSICTAFLIFFFRQNIKSFPKDLVEAARIDGLNEWQIFFKIYMPAAKNTYAAAAIITFMNSWNNYLWPLVSLQSPSNRTVPLALSIMGGGYTPDYGMMMTSIVVATIPTAIIFFVLQRQFVQGMLGAVK
ncbi:carbohydrate ABC transporter permease [Enterococcus italicus]|uniref:carbohydrate ABC transporter permease n=1 Tax=Enterococcus italicus TaxID=246144 RepID=UPI003F46035C